MIDILNLGGSVQSSTVFLMACDGLLPKPTVALFADTGFEPPDVYRYLKYLAKEGRKQGIPITTVSKGTTIQDDALRIMVNNDRSNGASFGSMPLYTLSPEGKKGQIRRTCTDRYKIEPIERHIKTVILGQAIRSRWPRVHTVRQWFGISADEVGRVRSPVRTDRHKKTKEKYTVPLLWKSHYYPLLDLELFPDRRQQVGLHHWLTRAACLEWCRVNGFATPPRSSCITCPYHSNEEWRRIKADRKLWAQAVAFDKAIRQPHNLRGLAFLHPARLPLDEVDLGSPEGATHGCDSGHCFM